MKIEIDQSGKIENTSVDTVLCIAHADDWYAIVLPSKTKRTLQYQFRSHGMIRVYILCTFSALLSILLRALSYPFVVVDREYWGHEEQIAKLTYEMIGTRHPKLSFRIIGKRSFAHLWAYEVAKGRKKPHKTVTLIEMHEALKKTEVFKRLQNA